MIVCLLEAVNKEVGYEAQLADLSYDIKTFECRGLQMKFNGYEQTLLQFASKFLEIMQTFAQMPFPDL